MLRPYFKGWRAGLCRATAAAAVITVTNIVLFSVAVPRLKRFDPRIAREMNSNPKTALYDGNCETAKQLSIWLHLLINILATILLAAGNYVQQVLTAPTRHEIDLAHDQRQWLDIGVSSILPIHLLYNSVISFETSVNDYGVFLAREKDLASSEYELPNGDSAKEFQRLENQDCIDQYSSLLLSKRSDVVLVVANQTLKHWDGVTQIEGGDPLQSVPASYAWICMRKNYYDYGEPCDVSSVAANPGNWTVSNLGTPFRVNYCLSKQTEEHCRLIMSVPIFAVVVACNIIKLIGLALTWLFLDKRPLLTLGDAVACFLERPDPTTRDSSLISKTNGRPVSWEAGPRPCIVALVAALAFLGQGIDHLNNSGNSVTMSDLWEKGFGRVHVDSLISFNKDGEYKSSAAVVALVSNLPQLIISGIYTAVNGMWTAMLVQHEWNSYGTQRKGLRTTTPVGQQRSTYWLSLPLSIFFVRLRVYAGNKITDGITTCGYSAISIIFSIIFGFLIMLATILGSLRPLTTAVPPVGSCSAVVSAACHPPEEDRDVATELVQWGVVSESDGKLADHCCITSWVVEPPEPEKSYE
ncbi:hypothetical protein ACJ41O_012566 [Fusarium nematophilum]